MTGEMILTPSGEKIPCRLADNSPRLSLPLLYDESKKHWYYFSGSALRGVKPLMCVIKKSGDFKKDVLNYSFELTKGDLEYIFHYVN